MATQRRRHLSDSAVITRLGISRRTFYRLLKDGTITPPLAKLAKNRRGWTIPEMELARAEMTIRKEAR